MSTSSTPPTHIYDQSPIYTSCDVFARPYRGTYSDRTISCNTGKFIKFKAQATEDVRNDPQGGATWKRRKIKSIGPRPLKVSNWVLKHMGDDINRPFSEQNWEDIAVAIGKSIAVSPLTLFLNIAVKPVGGDIRNWWKYDPVPYRYFGRAKTSRNPKDDLIYLDNPPDPNTHGHEAREIQLQSTAMSSERPAFPATATAEKTPRSAAERTERTLLPRKLCWLDTPPLITEPDEDGVQYKEYLSTDVASWMRDHKAPCPEYLFVAWRRAQFDEDSYEGTEKLHEMARQATREAGLDCYWISENCLGSKGDPKKRTYLDVWRMSDVVRGASSMVIALGNLPDESKYLSREELLYNFLSSWSQSIWTFPELLLSKGSSITCYLVEETDPSEKSADLDDLYEGATSFFRKEVIPKNQFAARVLETSKDRYQVRRLIDHYAGNLKLSDLELTTVALECFSSREAGQQFLPGDYSYALMGLLGRRPKIHPSDSAFLAFARLSLENYNNRLFERIICLLQDPGQKWYDTADAYGARLWDIEPSVQVAGIGVYNEQEAREDVNEYEFEEEFFLSDTNKGEQSWREKPLPKRSTSSLGRLPSVKRQFSGQTYGSSYVPGQHNAGMPSQGSFHSQAPIYQPPQQQAQYQLHPACGQQQQPQDPFGMSSTKSEHTAYHAHHEPPVEKKEHAHNTLTETDVVILDGCHAATIHWDKFHRVAYASYPSFLRTLTKWLLRLNIIFLILGAALASLIWLPGAVPIGAIFLIHFFIIQFSSPFLVRRIYGGKFWVTQPWFFGFEGYLPIQEIESKIWGANLGRLSWSFYASSPLAVHRLDADGRYIVPEDPTKVPETAELVRKARQAKPGDMRVFTLVDTYSMTVTLFEARRPPEALLICGSEGGMQRALGCSFEWTTQTFFKETVLRLETRVLDKMDRIRRVRLGIRRTEKGAVSVRGQY